MRKFEKIYEVVKRIPKGRVATYGQVAQLAGFPGRARMVGYAMAALPHGTKVPWHRVVNAQGGISPRALEPGMALQRILLSREGILTKESGIVPLIKYRWAPPSRRSYAP